VRSSSLSIASCEVRMEDMVSVATAVALVRASSVSRYVDGNTVKEDRISPIWQVTAVHGRTPMNAPMAH